MLSTKMLRRLMMLNGRESPPDAEERVRRDYPRLFAAMEAAKPCLCFQGHVVGIRGKKCFAIRYREVEDGKTVHRSIGLGNDPQAAQAARHLIHRWQSEAANDPDLFERNAYRIVDTSIELADLGARQRRRLRKYARQLIREGRFRELWCLYLRIDQIPRARRGRVPRGARWGSLSREIQREFVHFDFDADGRISAQITVSYDEQNRWTERRVSVEELNRRVEELLPGGEDPLEGSKP